MYAQLDHILCTVHYIQLWHLYFLKVVLISELLLSETFENLQIFFPKSETCDKLCLNYKYVILQICSFRTQNCYPRISTG